MHGLEWSPAMILENDDTYGCWNWTNPHKVFLRPEECSQTAMAFPETAEMIGNKIRSADVMLKWYNGKNKERISFALFAIENSGHLISSCLHELWHKEQFNKNKFYYILSCIATNIFGYDRSLTKKWSIEWDVRDKVDNEKLKERLFAIEKECRLAISCLNFMDKPRNIRRRKNRSQTTTIKHVNCNKDIWIMIRKLARGQTKKRILYSSKQGKIRPVLKIRLIGLLGN